MIKYSSFLFQHLHLYYSFLSLLTVHICISPWYFWCLYRNSVFKPKSYNFLFSCLFVCLPYNNNKVTLSLVQLWIFNKTSFTFRLPEVSFHYGFTGSTASTSRLSNVASHNPCNGMLRRLHVNHASGTRMALDINSHAWLVQVTASWLCSLLCSTLLNLRLWHNQCTVTLHWPHIQPVALLRCAHNFVDSFQMIIMPRFFHFFLLKANKKYHENVE